MKRNNLFGAAVEVEELQALLQDSIDRVLCIRTHAQHQTGNWTRVFVEAEMARRNLATLHNTLADCWDRIYGLAMYDGLPREDEP